MVQAHQHDPRSEAATEYWRWKIVDERSFCLMQVDQRGKVPSKLMIALLFLCKLLFTTDEAASRYVVI